MDECILSSVSFAYTNKLSHPGHLKCENISQNFCDTHTHFQKIYYNIKMVVHLFEECKVFALNLNLSFSCLSHVILFIYFSVQL